MLSAREMQILASVAAKRLAEARLKKVIGLPPETFVLRFHTRAAGDLDLALALRSDLPRVNLLTERATAPRHPSPFVERLRAELKSARLTALDTLPGERIVRLGFSRGDACVRLLYVELLPAARNLLVCLPDGTLRLVLRAGSTRRRQRPGAAYLPPETPPLKEDGPAPFAFLGGEDPLRDLPERLEAWIAPRDRAKEQDERGARLKTAIARALKKQQRLADRLAGELAGLPDAEELRLDGDALKAGMGSVKRGASRASLRDWGSGEEHMREIELDPKLDAHANLERIYKRARRSERARPRLEGRLLECEARLAAIRGLEERLDACTDEESLAALAEEARQAGLPFDASLVAASPAQGVPARKTEHQRRRPYRTYRSKDGIEILVGRTARDNDELTFKVARGNDWWLHVDGHSGSHVVVRHVAELPHETLLDAAQLAAHYSRAPRGSACDVTWTRRKWVRKFRGASPGQVQLAERHTLRVRPDPPRLERLKRDS